MTGGTLAACVRRVSLSSREADGLVVPTACPGVGKLQRTTSGAHGKIFLSLPNEENEPAFGLRIRAASKPQDAPALVRPGARSQDSYRV